MKRILFLILIFFSVVIKANADVMPYYINSLKRYGIGYSLVQSPVIMRQEPNSQGKILETLNFNYNNEASCIMNNTRCSIDEIFAAYSTKNKVALLTTLDTTEGWDLVCFNQLQNPICGWVSQKQSKFYNWSEFFDYFGKKFGVYLFKDLQKTDKILYAAPLKQTNATGSIEIPRKITPWLVRGNWLLVKVYDFNNQQKTGWINFRGDNGKLKLFVKF